LDYQTASAVTEAVLVTGFACWVYDDVQARSPFDFAALQDLTALPFAALVQVVIGTPLNGTVELAGPERYASTNSSDNS
jgi:hypothetical protein